MSRKMDDKIYLRYLFQSLKVDDLKKICKDFEIKGYSKLKKTELIDFILDSTADEEISELLKQKELEIISSEINLALKKINDEDRENISKIEIVNQDNHEIKILFKGFNWEVTSFLSITKENIENPERDCDCRIGSNMGFCNHFWIGFIFSLKEGYFKLSDWTLTLLPDDFKEKIKSIKLVEGVIGEEKAESVSIVDESSDSFQLMGHIDKNITVYEGEIEDILERQQDFQGNITTYYVVTLKNAKFGPRVQKKSDFREEDIVEIEKLKLRISEKLKNDHDLKNGDKIGGNGKLTKDNFLGFIVKNIRKIEKI
ncbi:MAG: Rho termination factor N-terminal domain-containing protein [Candidatus Thorarchaeota archaeon]